MISLLKNIFRHSANKRTKKMREVAKLPIDKLKNCTFLPNRYSILNKLKKNAVIAEVGVLGGDFSREILQRCNPTELHLIDLFNCDDYIGKKRFTAEEHEKYIRNEFSQEMNDGLVHIHKSNSWQALAKFSDAYFDCIYIDAAHDYESVKKDLKEAGRALKHDGIIIMNDYILYDHISHAEYGVVQATNEFILSDKFEMLYFAFHPQLFCDVAIRRRQHNKKP